MIARTWHGVTSASKADEHLEFLEKTGVKDDRATMGNRGVFVLRKVSEDRADFLLEFEPVVTHHEVLVGP